MKLHFVPISECPPEWMDGRQCLAVDKWGDFRVVKWVRHEGWAYWSSEGPFAAYPYTYETMDPAEIAEILDVETKEWG